LNEPTPLRRSLLLGAWLVWMGIMFYFSTKTWGGAATKSLLDRLLTLYAPPVREFLTAADIAQINYVLRKLAHFTEYAILTVLGYWAWAKGVGRSPQQSLQIAFAVSILFAISDEFHQRFVPGRTSLMTDVLIDGLGASVAAFAIQQWVVAAAARAPSPPDTSS
jgi:VanZ family protein